MYKDKPFHIGTVRFTNKIMKKILNGKREKSQGCIYGLDTKITDK